MPQARIMAFCLADAAGSVAQAYEVVDQVGRQDCPYRYG
jgi:hypothetical protein